MEWKTISIKSIVIVLLIIFYIKEGQAQDWTHYVRTAGHGLKMSKISHIVKDAEKTYLSGIEVDNDIPGRYKSFLDPTMKLKAIKAMADSAHAHQQHAFVYIAGLEGITGGADTSAHTFFKDHPDWVQRNRDGEPAIFKYGDAFWISKGDEDAWISPYAIQWRKLYMKRVRQIATTGIDGIYIDIPYWMTHFKGWEDTWASFDKYTVHKFKKKTGINALKDFDLGDWSDPDFIAWVDFRIKSITKFISKINKNIKSVNPDCKTILEIYPGLDEAVPRVGADNYNLSQVSDVITHEYNPGENSASREPLEWMQYMIAMYTFRTISGKDPVWMLSYSWDGEHKIEPSDAMKNLFMSQVMAGTNSWDASRLVMSGSNNYDTRTKVYKWINKYKKLIYAPRKTISPVGVYLSPKTRNYFSDEWREAYFGIMQTLIENHLEFEIITPRTLSNVSNNLLILPDVKSLSNKELSKLNALLKNGKVLIFTGKPGYFDGKRKNVKNKDRIKKLTRKYDNAIYFQDSLGISYYKFMNDNYNASIYKEEDLNYNDEEFNIFLSTVKKYYSPAVTIKNANNCVTQIASVDNKPTLFIANFSGLKGKENAIPFPKTNVTITFKNLSKNNNSIKFIPFLGKPISLKGHWDNDHLTVSLPTIFRGAIVTIK